MPQFNFNAADHEPVEDNYEAIPKGDYEAAIVASEMKATKAGNGHYLSFTVEILGPTHKGRKVFHNLNVDNPNPQAKDIAMRELRSVCDAVGLPGFRETEELHDKPLVIRVKHETYNNEAQARIASWKPVGASTPINPAPAQPQSPAANQTGEKKPWE